MNITEETLSQHFSYQTVTIKQRDKYIFKTRFVTSAGFFLGNIEYEVDFE